MVLEFKNKIRHSTWLPPVLHYGGIALAYFIAARIGLFFILQPEGLAGIWPASGLALAVLLLSSKKNWPSILVIIFSINTLTNLVSGNSLPVSLGFACANTLEPAVGAWLARYIQKKEFNFRHYQDALALFLVAIAANGFTALLGAWIPVLAFGSSYWSTWWVWWSADGLGILVFTPLIIIWFKDKKDLLARSKKRWIELIILLIAVGFFTWLIFGTKERDAHLVQRPYMLFPLLTWAALRFNRFGTTTVILLTATIAISNTILGTGIYPLQGTTPTDHLVLVQIYLCIISMTALLQSIIFSEFQGAEKDLRYSEHRLKQAQKVAHVGSWVWNIKTNLLEWSDEMFHIFGINRENFNGNLADVMDRAIHPEDRLKVETANRSVIEKQKPVPLEYRVIWPDGSAHVVWAEAGELFTDQSGQSVVLSGIVQDITERKKVEEEILLKDQLLHMTEDMAQVGGWEFDAVTKQGTWTDSVARIHDMDPDQKTSVEIGTSFYSAESRLKIEKAIQEAVEQAKPYDLELEMISARGIHKWVRTMGLPIIENGTVVKVRGFFQDITEQKRVEDNLRINAERLSSLLKLNQMYDVSLQEIMDFALEEAVRLTRSQIGFLASLSEDETLITMSAWSRASQKEKVVTNEITNYEVAKTGLWGEAIRQRQPVIINHYDEAHPKKKGLPMGHVPLKSTLNVPILINKRIVMLAVVGNKATPYDDTDVQQLTLLMEGLWQHIERRRTDNEMRQLNTELEKRVEERTAQLVTANQELEAFSYSVSHDLHAPLRSIKGFSQLLLGEFSTQLDQESIQYLDRINTSATRMEQLIDDLLKLSRVTRDNILIGPVNLSALGREIINSLCSAQPERRVEFILPERLIVQADKNLLRIALDNLIGNAWKFTEKCSHARIELGSFEKNGDQVIFVRDNGAGFDMTRVDKLFNAFQRLHADNEYKGTGIGLAIVQRIIHRHGGRIWAEGSINQGAAFFFTLAPNNRLPPENFDRIS